MMIAAPGTRPFSTNSRASSMRWSGVANWCEIKARVPSSSSKDSCQNPVSSWLICNHGMVLLPPVSSGRTTPGTSRAARRAAASNHREREFLALGPATPGGSDAAMAIVVIDPGHGGAGKVGGSSGNNATSPSGLLEKDLTLAVARHARAALDARGHDVRLTRDADVNLSLVDRAAVAKSARADTFVSIHFNGFGDNTVQGTETWVHQHGSAPS